MCRIISSKNNTLVVTNELASLVHINYLSSVSISRLKVEALEIPAWMNLIYPSWSMTTVNGIAVTWYSCKRLAESLAHIHVA
jgi:hypothetical protein